MIQLSKNIYNIIVILVVVTLLLLILLYATGQVAPAALPDVKEWIGRGISALLGLLIFPKNNDTLKEP